MSAADLEERRREGVLAARRRLTRARPVPVVVAAPVAPAGEPLSHEDAYAELVARLRGEEGE